MDVVVTAIIGSSFGQEAAKYGPSSFENANQDAANQKLSKYSDQVKGGMQFCPFAMDTAGGLGEDAHRVLRELARMGAELNREIAEAWRGGFEAYAGYLRAQFQQDLTAVLFRQTGRIISEAWPRRVIPLERAHGASIPTCLTSPGYKLGSQLC